MAIRYTDEMKDFLKKIVPGREYKEVLAMFNFKYGLNVSKSSLTSALKRFKIQNGLDTRFKKGIIAWNKGLKTGVKPSNIFKKGNITWNTKPIGSERIEAKNGYVEIKVAEPNKWERKHRWIYEQHYGKVPKGYVVIFADRNKYNFEISNLILVSRSELSILNQNHLIFDNKEATEAGIITAKLIKKIREAKQKS